MIPQKIKMTLDGELVQHTYDATTGKISYTPELFLAGGYHNVKVQIKDGFENPAELSWNFFITAGSTCFIEGPEGLCWRRIYIKCKWKGIK